MLKNENRGINMLKNENKEINEHQYVCSLFPAMQAYSLLKEIFSVFSSPDPVSKLCELDKDGTLILKVFASTTRDDLAITRGTFDNIYTGNLAEMLEALMFVFEVNFKDFLQGDVIGKLTERAKALIKQAPQESLVMN